MWAFLIFLFFLAYAHSIGGDTLITIILILIFLVWAYSITDLRTEEEKELDDKIYNLLLNPEPKPFRVTPKGWVIIIILLIIVNLANKF